MSDGQMNGAHRRWGPVPKWKEEWNALLGTDTDKAIAARLGVVTLATVGQHRRRLGIPSTRGNGYADVMWQPEWDELLGTMSDHSLSVKLGCNVHTVMAHRHKHGLARWSGDIEKVRALSDRDVMPDRAAEMSLTCGVAIHKITFERRRRGLLKRGAWAPQRNMLVRAAIGGMLAALGSEATLEQMGRVLHMTRERVRQLQNDIKAAWSEPAEPSRPGDAPR